jgi:hypothetical protein
MADEIDAGELAAFVSYAAFAATLYLREKRGLPVSEKSVMAAAEMLRSAHGFSPSGSRQVEVLLQALGESIERTAQ